MTPEQDNDIAKVERLRAAKPSGRPTENSLKYKAIWILYTYGYNLTELGEIFGLSRERIRMIIWEMKNKLGINKYKGADG